MNEADREKDPENDHQRGEGAGGNFRPGNVVGSHHTVIIRRTSHDFGVQRQEREGNQNLQPVAPDILLENMEDLLHWRPLDLIAFSRHGQKDGPQSHGAIFDISDFAEDAADFGAGLVLGKLVVNESNDTSR